MRPGIAAAIAMAALSASAFAQPASAQVVDERTRLRTKPRRPEDTTRRYIVQSPEQRAWNEAIDARNAAKKAKKLYRKAAKKAGRK